MSALVFVEIRMLKEVVQEGKASFCVYITDPWHSCSGKTLVLNCRLLLVVSMGKSYGI